MNEQMRRRIPWVLLAYVVVGGIEVVIGLNTGNWEFLMGTLFGSGIVSIIGYFAGWFRAKSDTPKPA
ncbi:MAG: hypothetical protein WCK74_04495 [Gemmatimonadaceae bacterium]